MSQMRTVPSVEPDASHLHSRSNASFVTYMVCPTNFELPSRIDLLTFHSLTVRSSLAVSSQSPSRVNATDQTANECPRKTWSLGAAEWFLRAAMSQIFTVLSALPVARNLPSALRARDRMLSLCASSVAAGLDSAIGQKWITPRWACAPSATMSVVWSGRKASAVTRPSSGEVRVWVGCHEVVSNAITVR